VPFCTTVSPGPSTTSAPSSSSSATVLCIPGWEPADRREVSVMVGDAAVVGKQRRGVAAGRVVSGYHSANIHRVSEPPSAWTSG
jgi:hypothetical protein